MRKSHTNWLLLLVWAPMSGAIGCSGDSWSSLNAARKYPGVVSPSGSSTFWFKVNSDQKVADELIPHLKHLPSVGEIGVVNVKLSKEQLEIIAQCPNVYRLSLSGCGVDDDDLAILAEMKGLHTLLLSQNPINGTGLSKLGGLNELWELNLSATHVEGLGLDVVARLPSLRVLSLRGTKVDDDGLDHLPKNTSLQRLDLGATDITPNGYLKLAGYVDIISIGIPSDIVGPPDDIAARRAAKAELLKEFMLLRKQAMQEPE